MNRLLFILLVLFFMISCDHFSPNSNFTGKWKLVSIDRVEITSGEIIFNNNFHIKINASYFESEDSEFVYDINYSAQIDNYTEKFDDFNRKLKVYLIKAKGKYVVNKKKEKIFKQIFYTGEDFDRNKTSFQFYLDADNKLIWNNEENFKFIFEKVK